MKLGSARGADVPSQDVERALVIFVLLWAATVGGAMLFMAPPLIELALSEAVRPSYVQIGVVTGCFSGVTGVLLAVFQKNHDPLRYRVVTVVTFFANIATGLLLVTQLRWGALGAVLGQMVGAALGCFVALRNTRVVVFEAVDTRMIADGIKIGVPLTLYAIGGLATDQLSRVFIERHISMSALGVYNIAYLYCTVLGVVCGAINTAWVPRFFQDATDKARSESSGLYGTTLVITAIGIGGVLSIISPDVLRYAVGNEFRSASTLIPLLMVNALLSAPIWTVIMNPLVLRGYNWWIAWSALVSGTCNILLNSVLTVRYGVVGAVFSSMAALLVLNGVAAMRSLREFPVQYDYRRILLALLSAGACYFVSRTDEQASSGRTIAMHVGSAVICALVAFLLLPRSVQSTGARGPTVPVPS